MKRAHRLYLIGDVAMFLPRCVPGTVFVLRPGHLKIDSPHDPDYVTIGRESIVYRTVSLTNYPSSNDFHGPVPGVKAGEVGMIMSVVGVPQSMWLDGRISSDPNLWEKYTVYEAVIAKEIVQVFGNDMEPLISGSQK